MKKIFETLFLRCQAIALLIPLLLTFLVFSPYSAQAQTKPLCDSDTKCSMGGDAVVGDDLDINGDLIQNDSYGAAYTKYWVRGTTGALTSGGTANCGTNLIPAGHHVYGCLIRVTTLITGATSLGIGDGTTATKWGATVGVTAGTATTGANFVAATTTATSSPAFYASAANLVITANGSNFTAGNLRCACLVGKFTALAQ